MLAFDSVNYLTWDLNLELSGRDSMVADDVFVAAAAAKCQHCIQLKVENRFVKVNYIFDWICFHVVWFGQTHAVALLTGMELLMVACCCCACQGIDDAGFDHTG